MLKQLVLQYFYEEKQNTYLHDADEISNMCVAEDKNNVNFLMEIRRMI